jgi:hypothetical protein
MECDNDKCEATAKFRVLHDGCSEVLCMEHATYRLAQLQCVSGFSATVEKLKDEDE